MGFPPFSAGADAWIISETDSRFYHRLNWLSNFSISRSVNHRSQKISANITSILENCELKNLDFIESNNDPVLLIGAEPFFPCRWLLVSPLNKKDPAFWSKNLTEKLNGLNVNSARVFYSKSRQKNLEGEASFNGIDVNLVPVEDNELWI